MSTDPGRPRNHLKAERKQHDVNSPDCCGGAVDRRAFIKLAGAAAASGLVTTGAAAEREKIVDHFVPVDKKLAPDWVKALFARGERRVYRGEQLETIGMPCGGICAGQLYVRGDGTLAQWWIANNAHKTGVWWGPKFSPTGLEVRENDFCYPTPMGQYQSAYRTYRPPSYIQQGFAISVKSADGPPQVRTLDREGFDAIEFVGEYPIAEIGYRDRNRQSLPVEISADVFSPFIPLNARDSALPATVLRYTVRNTSSKPLTVTLAGWLENMVGVGIDPTLGLKRRNRVTSGGGLTSVCMDLAPGAPDKHPQDGNMTLTVLDPTATATADWGSKAALLDQLQRDPTPMGRVPEILQPLDEPTVGALGVTRDLAPGASETFTFLVTWFFPHRYHSLGPRETYGQQLQVSGPYVGQMYANFFDSALKVAQYLAKHFERLDRDTHLFRDTYFDTTLPYWLVQRLGMPLSTLATETCQWWQNGRFWGWEGVGCCHGTCGHVWHYDQASARVFPILQRSVRQMQDFAPGVGFHANTGEIGFRGEGWPHWAGDSQGAYVMMAYREHLYSTDDAFLRRHWPQIKKATEFLIACDEDEDGLIESVQHNTYDINFFGANTMIGSMYLAALLAAEAMARHLGQREFAERCQTIFQRGSVQSVERLFNSEYFIQQVDRKKYPEWQYGDGCLSDQVIGQTWAHQLGLGYLYPADKVCSALKSVWKYNWAPDVGPQSRAHRPLIIYGDPGEAGLFLCTWPQSPHPGDGTKKQGVLYRNTIWTGIEFQVAANMIYEGLLLEGLAVIRAVDDRYDGAKHNPWNLILCGDHYARAMASWGCLLALSGFLYDGPAGRIGCAPRITPEDFRSVFTAAEGWGSISQRRDGNTQIDTIEVKWGQLTVKTLRFELPQGAPLQGVAVEIADKAVETTQTANGTAVTIELNEPMAVPADTTVEVTLQYVSKRGSKRGASPFLPQVRQAE